MKYISFSTLSGFDVYFKLVSLLILFIFVLIGVAFLTLLERKVLSYIQLRKGPNKVSVAGLLQPMGDAVKLFSKEQVYPYMSNYYMYYFSPMFNLLLSLILWSCLPFLGGLLDFNFSLLFFLCVSSVTVYTVMLAGWSSNSNYAMLGGLRSVAQSISYEVSLVLILLSLLIMVVSFSILDLSKYQSNLWFALFCFPLFYMWVVSCLAETNRTPFDFAEGESELVSGFNVEYSSGSFAMIFLSEYSNILFMSALIVFLFLGGGVDSVFYFLKLTFMSFFWLWVRGTLPRFRYDKLMYLAWKSYLPVSLNLFLFFFGVKIFYVSIIF